MNSHRAKQLLVEYFPGFSEPTREVRAALDLAERDPELSEWLARQQMFHKVVRKELRAIEVPAGLREKLLAQRRVVPLWRKHSALYAAAAVLVASLTIMSVWFGSTREDISVVGYQNRMVSFALREYRMDLLSEDRGQIRDFLAGRGAPADYALPSAIDSLRPMGGARLSWQGNPVAMLCYEVKKNEIAYVFVMDEKALSERGHVTSGVRFETTKGLNTAIWKHGSKIYLVTASVSQEELRALVEDTRAAL